MPTCSRGVLARALPACPPFAAPPNVLLLTLPLFPNVLALALTLLPNVLVVLALPLLSGAAENVVNGEGRGCGSGCCCCGCPGYAWNGGIGAGSMDGAGVEDMT